MPRRTKKQKLVTEYRRRLSVLSKPAVNTELKERPKEIAKSISIAAIPVERMQTDTSYIIQSLRKTILLSVLAVGIELVIYFVTNS